MQTIEEQITELVDLTRDRIGAEAGAQVAAAAEMACAFHAGQMRKLDGTPYVTHVISVAHSCLTWGLIDVNAICAALLHDAIEDAPASLDAENRIERYSSDVAAMVRSLSKIRNLQTGAGDMVATYRRILAAASKDLRVLVVKTFDWLHNSESLHVHGPAKSKIKASMGLIYVGVARRLGMISLADTLIERLLPHLMPIQTLRARKTLISLQKRGAESMERLTHQLHAVVGEGLALDYILEPKKIGDYFLLAEKPGTGQLSRVGWPVYRLKLLVPDDDTAWRVLGRVHSFFGPLPRHIRDYLNAPRVNGFRALTTRVIWEGHPLKVHIVNPRDEEANRMGILANWGKSGPDISRYMSLLATLGDSDLRMSEVHAHVLPDLLDVYTPKGDRLTFPVGSVVVDFAYLVHTELGQHCVGARVNGIQCPPEQPLADGDVVQILTAKGGRPQRAWIDVVKTARARTMIKQAMKEQKIPVKGVERKLDGQFLLTSLGAPDLRWSACCFPVPGDAVVGRISADGQWIVHRADCPKAQGPLWEKGGWNLSPVSETLNVTFTLDHQTGALLPVLELMAKYGINGHSIQSKGRSGSVYTIAIEMGGKDPFTLGSVLNALMCVPSVKEIKSYHWKG
ncbi:MAG: bifunctional (p)ppGpp synthetase/guanosine-3',5'-bis(diphosphate) 3'-pyrophosphohydrolase [Magnetococcales bacterium]|nr:bifunctional (p)ppGpp synthetase/guanosine-3',5'-bis(diphosphate) 3'-pyrophosphohydrolase [Magnetococcales bacterium]